MRLKKLEDNKTSNINFRCRLEQEYELRRKANIYCEGNLSEYLLYAGLNFLPSKDDFEVRKKKKGRK